MKGAERGGLTVAEAVVSMALILLVTGVIANLVSRSSHLIRFGDSRSKKLEVIAYCFNTLRGEVEGCSNVIRPDSTSAVSVLEVEQTEPGYSFPDPLYPSPIGWDWSAIPSIVVRYALSENTLVREAMGEYRVVAEGLDSFSASLTTDGNLDVSISLQQDGVVQVYSLVALRP